VNKRQAQKRIRAILNEATPAQRREIQSILQKTSSKLSQSTSETKALLQWASEVESD
jgi:arginine repressor